MLDAFIHLAKAASQIGTITCAHMYKFCGISFYVKTADGKTYSIDLTEVNEEATKDAV